MKALLLTTAALTLLVLPVQAQVYGGGGNGTPVPGTGANAGPGTGADYGPGTGSPYYDARYIRGTGTGSSSTSSTTTPAVTSGTFYGDSSYASANPALHWALLTPYNQNFATNSAANSTTAVVGYVCGRGVTGGAASGAACQNLYFNSTGTLNLTNFGVSTGSATTNPCFNSNGTDGSCSLFLYDEIAQIAGTPPTTPTSSTQSFAGRPYLFQNCSNNNTVTTTTTSSCLVFAGSQLRSFTDFNPSQTAQPVSFLGVFGQSGTGRAGYLTSGNIGTNPSLTGSTTANLGLVNAGVNQSFTENFGAIHGFNALFSAASSIVTVDGTLTTTASSVGIGVLVAGSLQIGNTSGGGLLNGVSMGAAILGGTTAPSSSTMLTVSKTYLSAPFGLGY